MTFRLCAAAVCVAAVTVFAAEPADVRLAPPRTLNSDHNLTPPTDKAAWAKRCEQMRERILLASGLWPMPEKTPLNAVVHGAVDRGSYTVEKVFFQSYPGFYCTGNLYKPKGRTGKLPGILCPHGHWANGRFYTNGEAGIAAELKSGRETDAVAAKYPLQARMANLAMQGHVVFHYDMVGYADSYQVTHRFANNTPSELGGNDMIMWGHGVFGLQTWNSIRSLDFLLSLPEVDPKRIGVTGASGGGTQTFILCAIDDRIAVSVPAVMVSTTMQGGCQCENSHHLRVESDSVEFAALFAPKPQLLICATGDWTKKIPEVGFPEIKATYNLLDAGANVEVVRYDAPHNYNKKSREAAYAFFGKHLLGEADATKLAEKPFVAFDPKELSVWTAEHPKPKDALTAEGLAKYLVEQGKKRWELLEPKTAEQLKVYRHLAGRGLAHVCATELPSADQVTATETLATSSQVASTRTYLLSRKGAGEQVPAKLHEPAKPNGEVVLVVSATGIEGVGADYWKLVESGWSVASIDAFLTAPKSPAPPDVTKNFHSAYNRTTVGNRVHDILTAVAWLKGKAGVKNVHLVGLGEAGVWATLARGLAGDAVGRAALDNFGYHFSSGKLHLPNSVALGGMRHLTPLAAPGELLVFNTKGTFTPDVLESVYKLSGGEGKWKVVDKDLTAAEVIDWLTRK